MFVCFTGEGKTKYTFSVSVNAFSVEFPLACYQQAGRVWYISGALRRTYTLFYPTPCFTFLYSVLNLISPEQLFYYSSILNKIQLTGRNLGRVFNSRSGRMHGMHLHLLWSKTAQLKVENLTQTTFRLSPVSNSALLSRLVPGGRGDKFVKKIFIWKHHLTASHGPGANPIKLFTAVICEIL